ncbi:MAG: hypothetical protein EBT03_11095, partial [Betaproteobacteria bacterium]|nr:hypothetical protein [Betaproteobacteria bacterium]
GLEHIHHYGILHRDIKPENIFVDKRGTCVIGDFGLAYILSSAHCEDGALSAGPTAACGTSIYAAYELVYNPSKRPYTSAVDLWSLGVTLYVCAEKNIPFYRSNVVPADWDDGDLCFNRCWREEQYELMQLIKELLRKDPQQRLTAIQVLQHPLFATNAS